MTTRRARGGVLAACTIAAWAFLMVAGGGTAVADVVPDPSPRPSQTTTYDTVPEKFSLTVSPTRLVIGPDDAGQQHTIQVVNRGESPLHVDVQIQSFVGGIGGSLTFQDDAPYSAANWVAIEPASFDLQPGTSQDVTASILVPPNPDLGDHQVALVFLVPAGETAANIKINRGVATPVYITVPGATDDSVEVSDLAAPGFSAGGPVEVTASVQNVGTVHRDFRGDTALPITGGDGGAFPDFTVARGGDRDISAQWQPPLFCICDLTVSIANAAGTSTTKTVRVVVFPVIPVVSVVGGLAVVALLLVFARGQYRKGVRQAAAELRASAGSGDD